MPRVHTHMILVETVVEPSDERVGTRQIDLLFEGIVQPVSGLPVGCSELRNVGAHQHTCKVRTAFGRKRRTCDMVRGVTPEFRTIEGTPVPASADVIRLFYSIQIPPSFCARTDLVLNQLRPSSSVVARSQAKMLNSIPPLGEGGAYAPCPCIPRGPSRQDAQQLKEKQTRIPLSPQRSPKHTSLP